MSLSRLAGAVVTVAIMFCASAASAQPPSSERPLEGTAGYMFTKYENSSIPFGFYGEVSRSILPEDRNLAWLGRFDFARDSEDDASSTIWHLKVGVRLKFPQGMFVPYVQGVGGFARDTFSYEAGNQDFSSSQNGLSVGGGGGVFVPVGMNNRFQVAVDYNRDSFSSGYNSWQIFFGFGICPGCASSMSPASGSSN